MAQSNLQVPKITKVQQQKKKKKRFSKRKKQLQSIRQPAATLLRIL